MCLFQTQGQNATVSVTEDKRIDHQDVKKGNSGNIQVKYNKGLA